jgi:uncharacterized protein (UPF0335 family)
VSEPGHNATGGIAAEKLQAIIARIEKVETEQYDLALDKREIYAEAKGNGFDTKIIRQVIRLKKMEEPDRREQDELLRLYRAAAGIDPFS